MAYSLVGSLGVVSVGASPVTPAWGVGSTQTAGNLLVCWVGRIGTTNPPTTPTGWTLLGDGQVALAPKGGTDIYYKIADGGDTAPTITGFAGTTSLAVMLAEFSGNDVISVLNRKGNKNGGTSGTSIIAGQAAGIDTPDTTSGELVVVGYVDIFSANQTATTANSFNNGTSVGGVAENDATSIDMHYNFCWAITAGNAAATTDTFTYTTPNVSVGGVLGTFNLPATDPGYLPSVRVSNRGVGPQVLRFNHRQPWTRWIDEGVELPIQFFTPIMVRIPSARVGPPALRRRFMPRPWSGRDPLNVNIIATAADALGALSDAAVRAPQAFLRTVSDALAAITETTTRIFTNPGRTASDALDAISDAVVAHQGFSRQVADTLNAISDTAARSSQSFVRTAADTLGAISEATARLVTNPGRTASDALGTISEVATSITRSFRTAADNLGAISDSAIRAALSRVRTASDTLNALSDTAARAPQAFVRSAADNLGALSDTAIRGAQSFVRTVADSLGALSDSTARLLTHPRTASDALSAISDTAVRGVQSFVRTAADALGAIVDSAVQSSGGTVHLVRTAADTLGAIADSVLRKTSVARTSTDALGAISDLATRLSGSVRTAADALGALTDAANRGAQNLLRTAADALGVITETIASWDSRTAQYILVSALSRSGILLTRSRDHIASALSRGSVYLARARDHVATAISRDRSRKGKSR